jgi:hypothetical protein
MTNVNFNSTSSNTGFWCGSVRAILIAAFLILIFLPLKAQNVQPYANFVVTSVNPISVGVCDEFTVTIAIETTGPITNAELHMQFQTTQLEVVSLTQPIDSLFDLVVLNPEFNNSTGTISFAAGIINGVSASETYPFITILFKALEEAGTAEIEHVLNGNNVSRVVSVLQFNDIYYGIDVLNNAENALVNLNPDIVNPVVEAPSDLIFFTDPGVCQKGSINPGVATAYDNCGILTLANDIPPIFPIGTTVLNWFTTDFSGNFASDSQLITIVDGEVPILECESSSTRIANYPNNTYEVIDSEFDLFSKSDNCTNSVDISVSHNASTIPGVTAGSGSDNTSLNNWFFPLGTTTVFFYAEDFAGNIDSCSIEITVIPLQGYADFVITSVTPVSVASCDSFIVSIAIQTIGPITSAELQMSFLPELLNVISVTQPVSSPFELIAFPPTFNNIEGTLSFAAGIIGGISNPGIYPFLDVIIQAVGDAGVAEVNHLLNAANNSRINTVVLQNDIFQSIDVLQSVDNVAVSLIPETIVPEIFVPQDLIIYTDFGVCHAQNVNLGEATATDNCSIPLITNDAPMIFPVGLTVVNWFATDLALNVATASQNVTLIDNEAPLITCAAGGTRIVNQPNSYQINGNEFDPVDVSDNCTASQEIVFFHNASSLIGVTAGPGANNLSLNNWQFPIGSTIVLFIAEDFAGNTDTCSVEIVVNAQIVTISTNINGNCAPGAARVLFYEPGIPVLVATIFAVLDANSNVVVDAGQLIPGNYDVYLKIERFLQKGFLNVDITSNPAISATNFKAGDISGMPDIFNDNVINGLDLSLLLGSYNTVPASPNYNARCDLNCNVVIDALDLSLILSNYFTAGDNI